MNHSRRVDLLPDPHAVHNFQVLYYIDVSAAFEGVDPGFTLYLVSIANAGSAVGRLSSGFLTDAFGTYSRQGFSSIRALTYKFSPLAIGPLNVIIPFTTVAAITTFIWPYVTSKGGYIVLALAYGYALRTSTYIPCANCCLSASSGVYASMLTAPIVVVGGTDDVGLRVGMFFTIVAMGALAGPPISGAINNATGNYKATGYYAGVSQHSDSFAACTDCSILSGVCILVSVVILIITRQLVLGRRLLGHA